MQPSHQIIPSPSVPPMSAGRLKRALRLDNGGRWFVAFSKHSAQVIESRFSGEYVAQILYESIGGILEGPMGYLYIQIQCWRDVLVSTSEGVTLTRRKAKVPNWNVVLALRELGVYVDTEVSLSEVFQSKIF